MDEISSSSSFLVEANSKFLDMESIKSYSTKDEYLYAMKEDLAEWFNSMYATNLTAETFIDSLENGVLICEHANNVVRAANEANKGIEETTQQTQIYYKADAKPQSFQARDNVSNFIKWSRNCAKVRECLMFETDDLILRKNEKHFILCLLEIARYGSKFGLQVPTIIRLEQEIDKEENEMNDKQNLSDFTKNLSLSCDDDDVKYEDIDNNLNDSLENDLKSSTSISISPSSSLTSSTSSISINKSQNQQTELLCNLKATSSVSSISPPTSTSSMSISLLENHQQNHQKEQPNISNKPFAKKNLSKEFNKNLSNNKASKHIKSQSRSSSVNKLYNRSRSNSRNTELETELEKHVNKIVNRCTCEKKFPLVQISEGKYRIGNTKTIVFIRILRNHIMVRVGGGWDTLENYLNKHDPCRTISCNHNNDPNICCHSVPQSQQIHNHQKVLNDNNSKYIIHYEKNNNTLSNPILLTPIESSSKINTSNSNQRLSINNINSSSNQLVLNSNQIIISTPSKQAQQLKSSESTIVTPSVIKKYPLQQNTYQVVGFTDAQLIIQREQQQGKGIDNIYKNTNEFLISSSLKETVNRQANHQPQQAIKKESANARMNPNYDRNNSNSTTYNNNNNNNNRTSTTKMNEFFNKNHILQQHLQQQQYNKYDHQQSTITSPFSYSSANSTNQQSNNNQHNLIKTESMIKSKVKKFINKLPNQHHNNHYQQQNYTNYAHEQDMNIFSKPIDTNKQPYKTITSYDNNTLIVSTNNNLDYMMFLPDTPVYTETNLPPRILRKYQKKALTEKLNAVDSDESTNDVFHLHQSKNQLKENDLVDLAKTIQDIYQIDDDISDDFNDNIKTNKSTTEIVYNSNKSIAPPPPSNMPPVMHVSPIRKTNNTSENVLSTFSSDQLKNEEPVDPQFLKKQPNFNLQITGTTTSHTTIMQSRFVTASSPKAPPRTKIKYRKSKTCDLKIMKAEENKYGDDDFDDYETQEVNNIENNKGFKDEMHADSLESLNKSFTTLNSKNEEKVKHDDTVDTKKYTFSLNYLNNDKNKFFKFIPLNNPHQIDVDELFKPSEDILNDSLEATQNESKNIESDQSVLPNKFSSPSSGTGFTRTYSRRAKWDKSPQNLDFVYFHSQETKKQNIVLPMVNHEQEQHEPELKSKPITKTKVDNLNNLIYNYATNTSKPIAAVIATPKQTQPNNKTNETNKFNDNKAKLELLNKKTRNLDIAKQKLVEMKKTMDAKMIMQNTSSNNSNSIVCTTNTNNDTIQKQQQKINTTVTTSRTTPRKIKKRSGERSLTAGLILEHEINEKKEIQKNEIEFKETFGGATNSSSNSQFNSIVCKSQTQISSQKKNNQNPQRSTSASSLIKQRPSDSSSDIVTVRNRRDSIASNTSSMTNCTISSGVNEYKENKASELRKIANLKNKILTKQLDPIYTRNNPVATEITEAQSEQSKKRLFAKRNEKYGQEQANSKTNSSFSISKASNEVTRSINEEKPTPNLVKNKTEPSKSKSATDLYYNFERTNSTLDLLELMNDCDIPKGDSDQYKAMLLECEKLEKSIKVTNTTTTLSKTQQTGPKISKTANKKDKILKKDSNKTRSQSAPSYNRNPIINIVDYDQEEALKNVQ